MSISHKPSFSFPSQPPSMLVHVGFNIPVRRNHCPALLPRAANRTSRNLDSVSNLMFLDRLLNDLFDVFVADNDA